MTSCSRIYVQSEMGPKSPFRGLLFTTRYMKWLYDRGLLKREIEWERRPNDRFKDDPYSALETNEAIKVWNLSSRSASRLSRSASRSSCLSHIRLISDHSLLDSANSFSRRSSASHKAAYSSSEISPEELSTFSLPWDGMTRQGLTMWCSSVHDDLQVKGLFVALLLSSCEEEAVVLEEEEIDMFNG